MSNKPELPKINLKSLVGQIKSVIGSATDEPDPVTNDQLGHLMQSISRRAKQLGEDHAQLTQGLYELNEQVNHLFESLEKYRKSHPDGDTDTFSASAAAGKAKKAKTGTKQSEASEKDD